MQAESLAPQKKRKPRQPQSPTKTVRRRKKNDDNMSDPMKKRKPKQVPPTEGVLDPSSVPVSAVVGDKVKKRRKRKTPDEQETDSTGESVGLIFLQK